jgi:hypothetical protein
MTMQHDNQAHRLTNKMWAQVALFTVAIVIVITLAAKYVW